MLDTKTIIEKYSYIFEWLQLFDFIIIVIDSDDISCHNMVVALLVLILERTQMIGILKALGLTIGVRKFLYNVPSLTTFFVTEGCTG
jgi:lipoprotein-releasing system permease protein